MRRRIRRAGAAVFVAAMCCAASGAAPAGEPEASQIIEAGRSALRRGDLRAIERLAASDKAGTYEAVDQLLGSADGPDPLAEALALAYASAWQDRCLVDRAALFASFTPQQRAARAGALRLKQEGITAMGEGRIDDARAGFERALKVFQELGDLREEGRCLSNLGAVEGVSGHGTEALDWLSRAERVIARSGDRAQMASVKLNAAYVYQDLGDLDRAAEGLLATRQLAAETGDRLGEAAALLNLGDLHLSESRRAEARAAWEEALVLGRELRNLEVESTATLNLASLLVGEGDVAGGRARFEEAVRLARRGRVALTELNAHGGLVQIYRNQGDFASAGRHVEQKLALARALGDELRIAEAEISQGGLLADQARYREAWQVVDTAARRLELLEAPGRLSTALRMRGVSAFYLGRYTQAVDDLNEATRLAAQAAELSQEAYARESLGFIMMVLGDRRAALDQLTQAAAMHGKAGQADHQASTLDALGVLWFRAGDADTARRLLRESIALADPAVNPRTRAEARLDLAAVDMDAGTGDAQVIGGSLAEALAVFEEIGDSHGVALASLLQARLALRSGNREPAEAALARVERAVRSSQSEEFVWEVHHLRGEIAEQAGRLAEAKTSYERAVQEVERMRRSVRPALWRAAIQEDRLASYHALVRLHLAAGRDDQAWDAARRAKARGFADSQQAASLEAMPAALPEAAPGPRPSSAAPRAALQALLRRDELLLDFYSHGGEVILFAVTAESLASFRLSADPTALEAARHPGRPGSGEAAAAEAFTAACARLADQLLRPVAAPVAKARRLLISPSGPMHGLPFSALPLAGRALVETHEIAILPSAEALQLRARRRSAAAGLLAVGSPAADPSLPPLTGAAEEIDAVSSRYARTARRAVGSSATEALVRTAAAGYDLVHLAAHGFIDRAAPRRSFIALASGGGEDGRLEVPEIEQLQLAARAVILSGCETGAETGLLGSSPAADEREGLARAFLSAGAASVIGSLWELDDDASARIMPGLYPDLAVDGAASALARLQRAMRSGSLAGANGRPLDHPFYWAGLVAYGPGPGADR